MRPDRFHMLAGGELCLSAGRLRVVKRATEEVFVEAPEAGVADLDRVVSAGRRGFETWRRVERDEARDVLRRMAEVIAAQRDELVHLLVLEQGKPVPNAIQEVGFVNYFVTEIPFGGLKKSEFGIEGAPEGLRSFHDTRILNVAKPCA